MNVRTGACIVLSLVIGLSGGTTWWALAQGEARHGSLNADQIGPAAGTQASMTTDGSSASAGPARMCRSWSMVCR